LEPSVHPASTPDVTGKTPAFVSQSLATLACGRSMRDDGRSIFLSAVLDHLILGDLVLFRLDDD
jgi:hypothetical protein